MNFFQAVANFFQRIAQHISPFIRQIALGAAILVATALGVREFRSHASAQSKAWLANLRYASAERVPVQVPETIGQPIERQRLQEQMQEIQDRARLHIAITDYFYSRYFSSLTTAMILAIVAALCLTHIARVGWSNANPYVVAVLVTASGTAIFFRVSPALFRQEQNIADNKALYIQYMSLDNAVRTYLATKRLPEERDKEVSVSSFLLYVDKRLDTLNQIPLGFDQSQVPDYRSLKFFDEGK